MDKGYFLQRLRAENPQALEKFNYDLLPETFLATDNVAIRCSKHGLFEQRAYSHLRGFGCLRCSVEKVAGANKLSTAEFITTSKERFGNRFDYTKTVYKTNHTPLTLTCRVHGDLVMEPWRHFNKGSLYGCPKCNYEIPRQQRKERFLEAARNVHGSKYDYSRVEYVNSNDRVEIICPVHGSFWQGLYSHTAKKTGCPRCALDNNKRDTDEFIRRAKEIHGSEYDYGKVVYETGQSMVTITCPKHGDFIQRASSHLVGCKCMECFRDGCKLPTDDFISNARKIHGEAYDYSKVRYLGNKVPVEIICPTHGAFWQKPNTHVSSGNGCKFCCESKGERAVELVLKKYGIDFIREYRIIPHLYRFDFYLPEFDIYIEFNGHQHYRAIEFFGGEEEYLKTKERDEIKRQLVHASGGILVVLTHMNLVDGSVERELVVRLKRAYRHWFVIDGKVRAFKTAMDVYRAFNLPPNTLLRDIDSVVIKTTTARLLFEPL